MLAASVRLAGTQCTILGITTLIAGTKFSDFANKKSHFWPTDNPKVNFDDCNVIPLC